MYFFNPYYRRKALLLIWLILVVVGATLNANLPVFTKEKMKACNDSTSDYLGGKAHRKQAAPQINQVKLKLSGQNLGVTAA